MPKPSNPNKNNSIHRFNELIENDFTLTGYADAVKKYPDVLQQVKPDGDYLLHHLIRAIPFSEWKFSGGSYRNMFTAIHKALVSLNRQPLMLANAQGDLPIHLAAQTPYFRDNLYALDVLIPDDVDVRNAAGETALMLACMTGNGVVAEHLKECGASIRVKNGAGQSLLKMTQAAKRHADGCLISTHGVDIGYVIDWLQGNRSHPYYIRSKTKKVSNNKGEHK